MNFLFSFLLFFSSLFSPAHAAAASQDNEREREDYLFLQQEEGGADRIHPELQIYVQNVGERIARFSSRPQLPFEFTVLDNPVPNAWALPSGKIGINLGLLLELSSEAELAAVLGHEIAHATEGHTLQQIKRSAVLEFLQEGVHALVQEYWFSPLVDQSTTLSRQLILLKYSRTHELEADRLGIDTMEQAGYDPEAAVALQKDFLRLYKEKREGWLAGLFATHPPSEERVEANRLTSSRYSKGGAKGFSSYDRVVAPIREKKSAYEAVTKGRAALGKKKFCKALRYAEAGLAVEPKEPHLHQLKGEAQALLGKWEEALASLSLSISLNPDYFAYYLDRAAIFDKLGNEREAKKDRESAQRLHRDQNDPRRHDS
ncbi:MAG: hypothetical protein A3G30_04010 [Chlamydiae bacterium RIFCSPLOWO2_12_FULL_49_12]|nr:MAG: hypothetical protein A2Z85_04400 [Chlamydiae bacterium GWA2_50_15]OGN58656.1 MAG: hypothetical protein A3D18_00050 [Chlamydiae bacterium RIFCSPHIGHO2_02_FULL_49_29]OGN64226.1 MAG: hypothetical protein A3E26_06135 [Chlamydiae bacterium RIFCSPHIGHO2_12_FULL_49_32]OGN69529.1 MAG: hypothetical protein A3I15_02290 [Chlamydiae bacterium RIFCSPLOWO2_02_FULL_49_12]OGN71722.1 MAG: hypothetical protein A3G30_04010 [Chlamydiae bacterium RIFCSPLOWO2_12_FULL_49_12]HCJ83110.1 peptidase M48 [Parachla